MDQCEQCGSLLPARRKLKTFCSYACRGQHKALKAISGPSGLVWAKKALQNRALRRLKSQSVAGFSFARINAFTYRMDQPRKFGVGWLMEVSCPRNERQQWIARVGNRASEPLPLNAAKRTAVVFLREREQAEARDWIAELNSLAAIEADRVPLMQERKQWPRDLVGAEPRSGSMQIDGKLRDAILNAELLATPSLAEPLNGDGFWLEFYDDGYPKLPECLRRKYGHGDHSARIPTAYAA